MTMLDRAREVFDDLRSQATRAVVLLVVLTGVSWATLGANRQALLDQAAMHAALASPGASTIRVTLPGATTTSPQALATMSALDQVNGVLGLGEPGVGYGPFGRQVVVRSVWGDVHGDTQPTMWAVPCDHGQVTERAAEMLGFSAGSGAVNLPVGTQDVFAAKALPTGLGHVEDALLVRRCDRDVVVTEFTIPRAVSGGCPERHCCRR